MVWLAQWSRYVGAVATKTNSTQASEIDISSIKCLSYMSFHGVVVSTSASHSENRGSIPCKGIFPFFPIFWKKILYFEKRPMFVALWSLSVKSGKDETLEIKNLRYEFTPVVEFESVPPCGHLEIFLFLLNRIVIKVQISHFQNMFFGL